MALQALNLDSNKNIIYNPASLVIRQGESGIQLRVTMKENYSPIGNLSSAYLIFEAQKPDGTIIKDEDQSRFVKNPNGFYYTLNPATFQAVGNVKGHFIVQTGSITDTTSDFTIKVLSRDGKAQVSSDYISKAELVIANVNNRIEQINTLAASLTDQMNLTNTNLSAKATKFIEDTKTTVNSNIKTLTDNLNQLKNTFTTNIQSAEGVFNSKKSEIDDWFTAKQRDYTSQKQSIDSEWSAKKAEKDSDWLKLKASYDSKIAGLTNQYQASVDAQKKQLSDDLATFKSQLKSQLDSTQSTINQLKNADVPAISKKLDDIKKDIDKIDLDSVKKKADDAYSMAQSANNSVSSKADKGELNVLSGKVDTKASQSDLNNLGGRVTTAESDIRNLRNSKPDLSGYYTKSETYKRDEIDNKNLATQNQAVELVKSQLVGDKANLTTDDKTSVVSAINWLYQKINGAFDLSSPVVPYVNDSANYTNQNMIYLNSSGSYNFDASHTISYDSNFADSKLSNIGDGLKLWVKLRKKAYVQGVQQATNEDYPISYSSSNYVSGQYSTSVQSPIIINKSDIAVNSSSESKSIVVELAGVGEMQTGSKLAPKLKITNNGNANNLVIESIQGYNFDNPNSPQVNGGYYDLDVDRVANFELVRTPVNSLVSGTDLIGQNYFLLTKSNSSPREDISNFKLKIDNYSKVGDGIKIKVIGFIFAGNTYYYFKNNQSYPETAKFVFNSSKQGIIERNSTDGSYYLLIPKSQLIEGNVISFNTTNTPGYNYTYYYGFNLGENKSLDIKIKGKYLITDIGYPVTTQIMATEITTYKNNVLFDGGYKIGKSTNDVAISKKLNELKNGLIIKIDKLKLETVETNELTYMQQAFKPSDDVQVSFEENPNQAILTIPKDKIAVGKTLQTANAGTYVAKGTSWLYTSSSTTQRLNINFKNDNTLNFSAGFYSSNDSAIFISEIQEY